MKYLLVSTLFFITVLSGAQSEKKRIDHTVYDGWKAMKNAQVSDDGKIITYEINPQSGDGYLFIYSTEKNGYDSVSRGYDAKVMGKFVVFKIKPQHETIRQAKLAKKKDDDLPKDSLGIFDTETRKVIAKECDVKEFSAKQETSYFVCHHAKTKEVPSSKKKKKKRKKHPEIKSDGTLFEIIDTRNYAITAKNKKQPGKFTYPYVTGYSLSKKGELVAFIQQKKTDKTDSSYVYVFQTNDWTKFPKRIYSVKGTCKNVKIDDAGKQVAFLSSTDTSKNKIYDLWYWNTENSSSSLIADVSNTAFPAGWCVSEHSRLYFSENGKKLFFGTAVKPENEKKDTLTEDEKYKVDIWNWQDGRLQPEQLRNLENDKKKNYLAVYHVATGKIIQLCNTDMDDYRLVMNGDENVMLGISEYRYERERSWESPWNSDYYLVDLLTGEKKLLAEALKFNSSLSATGKYFVYYQRKDDNWYATDIAGNKTINLTENISEDFFEDDNGTPEEESAYGIMGWSEGDKHVYIYTKYDIWKIDMSFERKPVCLTKNFGKESRLELRNIWLDREQKFVDEKYLLLNSFNETTKQAGFYKIDASAKSILPIKLVESDHKYMFLQKAKNADRILFTRQSFTEYPDLWTADVNFYKSEKLSNANPQQREYNWGNVELIHWRSPKGKELDGLIYKPENFDSTKKYPLLIYYYEKYADEMHAHYVPRPSASIINPSEYCSNGYVVFFPDILYDEGSPGENAYDCIMSGMEFVTAKGYINKERMGLQGQSWGGYQTAYMVTQTNVFRAAMAGAPVSNMTSAYGGIRWESGLSRMFQYEKTQSRLGVTLWEDRERYIKNSPVFFSDKVETPLLIMHNDKDGAVPWYQGIEYFAALRRLNKPCWMLNYNDDGHNLTRRANQKDLSIRMRQFFDHYLLDQPMPEWMKSGLSAIDKGKKTGYDLKRD